MVLQASTLRKKLQNIEQISQQMRENVDSDSTAFNANYAEYRKERKSIFDSLKKHVKNDKPSPEIQAVLNDYADKKIFSTASTKTSLSSLRDKEPQAIADIKRGKTLSQYANDDKQSVYNKLLELYEDSPNEPFYEALKNVKKSEETPTPAPAPTQAPTNTEEERKQEEDEKTDETLEQEKRDRLKKFNSENQYDVLEEEPITVNETPAPAPQENRPPPTAQQATPPTMSPDEIQQQEQEQEQERQRTTSENAPPVEQPPQPAMTVNGQDAPMFLPETPIYQQTDADVGTIPQITQQQVLKALDVNSEESRVSKEERHRQESTIETLKKEIDCMHAIFDDLIQDLQTAKHRKEYADAIETKNIDSVRVHHRQMKKIISNYYKTTDLKVGVIVSAGSLFQQYNNDLRAVLGTSSAQIITQQPTLEKVEKGKPDIKKPKEIRPKQAMGGYAHAMRRGVSSRVPPTKDREDTNYKFKPQDMVKQYNTRRQYVVPSRMYNVPENIFVKTKN